MGGGMRVLGPLPCITCGAKVVWLREAGKYRLANHKTNDPHKCQPKEKAA
jgi:hypothetical protein